MQDGFLGYQTTFMLDVVAIALFVVVLVLAWSLFAVKVQKNYLLHKRLQILLGVVLLIAVGLFEVDIRLQGGIDGILAKRTIPLSSLQRTFFNQLLIVHLVFAITTVAVWAVTLTLALRRIPSPPGPCAHSELHKKLGWISALDITATSITGLLVYYYGFMV